EDTTLRSRVFVEGVGHASWTIVGCREGPRNPVTVRDDRRAGRRRVARPVPRRTGGGVGVQVRGAGGAARAARPPRPPQGPAAPTGPRTPRRPRSGCSPERRGRSGGRSRSRAGFTAWPAAFRRGRGPTRPAGGPTSAEVWRWPQDLPTPRPGRTNARRSTGSR